MTAEHEYRSEDMAAEDVVAVLKSQHEEVKRLFGAVKGAEGERRSALFDDLRRLLAVHETAEELVVRPVSKNIVAEVAEARNAEEKEANATLAELEKLDVNGPEFDSKFDKFEASVVEHAHREESQEFPRILAECDAEERARMGRLVRRAESLAPTHPHPTTAGSTAGQLMVGPFAAMADRVKDALSDR